MTKGQTKASLHSLQFGGNGKTVIGLWFEKYGVDVTGGGLAENVLDSLREGMREEKRR